MFFSWYISRDIDKYFYFMEGVHTPSSNDESKQPKYASYEELRQRNRSEFEQKQHSKLGSPETPQQYQKSPPPSPPSQGSFSGAPKRKGYQFMVLCSYPYISLFSL